jgi:hypothetical protein
MLTITLPSGCQADIRPIKIAEENVLASAYGHGSAQVARGLERVLAACVTGIPEPGVYAEFIQPGGAADWRRMLAGDKFVAMLELRKISYRDGAKFTIYDSECPAGCPSADYEIDLDADIIRRELDADSADHFRANLPFEASVAGKAVTFNMVTGATEDMVQKLQQQHPERKISCAMRARIVDVDGVDRRDILDWLDGANGTSKKFEGLTSQEGEELRDIFDQHECGIDTDVPIECMHCGRTYTVPLPFDGGFLMPSTGIRQRKRDRRLAACSARTEQTK